MPMSKTNNAVPFDLERYLVKLLQNEPFFATISRHVEKRASDAIPTAGVRVNGEGHFEMLYNPKFFEGLTPEHRTGVLMHEFYHLIFGHVTDRLPFDPDGEQKMNKKWNIATDLAINSHLIGRIPASGCIPGQGPFAEFPVGEASEKYYAMLPEQTGEGGNGQGEPLDDHSGWGDEEGIADPTVKEIAKQRLREMMREAANDANKNSNGWGTVSSEMRKEIMARINGTIDWRLVLRYFIKTSQRADKNSTVKKLNKRFPYIHAGKKVKRHAKIAISIDQSGSVGDEMLEKFFAELNSLAKIATFTVIPFDSAVDEKLIYEWKKGKHKKTERVMHGGTDFDAPTGYVNKHNFDGHIILTDMYAPKPGPSNCQRMWMTTPECADNPYFQTNERVIPVK